MWTLVEGIKRCLHRSWLLIAVSPSQVNLRGVVVKRREWLFNSETNFVIHLEIPNQILMHRTTTHHNIKMTPHEANLCLSLFLSRLSIFLCSQLISHLHFQVNFPRFNTTSSNLRPPKICLTIVSGMLAINASVSFETSPPAQMNLVTSIASHVTIRRWKFLQMKITLSSYGRTSHATVRRHRTSSSPHHLHQQ